MAKWDVIIVGAGISGLCAGALLSHAGKKVLVLEKENYLGGRATSTTYRGHIFDNCSHTPTQGGHLEAVFAEVGEPFPEMTDAITVTEIFRDGKWYDPFKDMDSKTLRKIITEIATMSYDEIEKYDHMKLKDWVAERTDDETIHLFFWAIAIGAYDGNLYEPFAAGENLYFIKEHLERVGNLGNMYVTVVGGMQSIIQPLAKVIQKNGGEIRTNTKVSEVIIEDGKARGVRVEVGEKVIPSQYLFTEFLEAEAVICTTPIWQIFEVINPDDLPQWYSDWIEGIKHRVQTIWAITYALDKPPEGFDPKVGKFVEPNITRTKLAIAANILTGYGDPAGETQMCCWWLGNYYEVPNVFELNKAKTKREVREFFSVCEEDVKYLFPDLEKHILWRMYHISPIILSAEPGLVGKSLPSGLSTGVENLYLASDCLYEARGVGTQSAARAGIMAARHILG